MAKTALNRKKTFQYETEVQFKEELVKCYILSTAFNGAETWTLRKVDQKYLESFQMWCWRRMEKISWTDHVRNERALFSQ
jgi:hypothetical protein